MFLVILLQSRTHFITQIIIISGSGNLKVVPSPCNPSIMCLNITIPWAKSDQEKADLFGAHLAEVFSLPITTIQT